jgi:hypothetical protein
MSFTGKAILSGVITYILTRVRYWSFNFHPTNDFPLVLGLVIDIVIWILLFYVVLQVVEKVVKKNVTTK